MLTPKSLLRHALTASTPRELADGRFQLVLDDEGAAGRETRIRRLVFGGGKIFADLISSERRNTGADVAIVRVEQVYPFPADELREIFDRYQHVREVSWVQEEPENMGAWEFVRPLLEQLIDGRWPLRYIGRSRNSSPSRARQRGTRSISAPSWIRRSMTSQPHKKRTAFCRSRCSRFSRSDL